MIKMEIAKKSIYATEAIKLAELIIAQCCPMKEPGLRPSISTSIKINEF